MDFWDNCPNFLLLRILTLRTVATDLLHSLYDDLNWIQIFESGDVISTYVQPAILKRKYGLDEVGVYLNNVVWCLVIFPVEND